MPHFCEISILGLQFLRQIGSFNQRRILKLKISSKPVLPGFPRINNWIIVDFLFLCQVVSGIIGVNHVDQILEKNFIVYVSVFIFQGNFSIFRMAFECFSILHFFIQHKSDFVESLQNSIVYDQKIVISSILGVGSPFEQITDNMKVISLDCCNKGCLGITCRLIHIQLVFFNKELDNFNVTIVAGPVKCISLRVPGKISIKQLRLLGEEFFNFIDFFSINVVTQILIVRVEMSNTLDCSCSHLKISKLLKIDYLIRLQNHSLFHYQTISEINLVRAIMLILLLYRFFIFIFFLILYFNQIYNLLPAKIIKDMNIARKNITSLFYKSLFRLTEAKVENKIGFIYMNSPKDFNALSKDMKKSLVDNVKKFEQSPDVKVILLLSKFEKAFCAGANIKEFQNKTSKDFQNNDIFQEIHDVFYAAKKPIIAGVNGVALGGGCELALLCDIVYCSEETRFALPELRLGLIPGIGGTQRLAKIAGKVNAMHYVLTSDFIYAPRAKELGIVSEVFKKEELHDKVIGIANEITNKPLSAILAAKQAIKQTENLSMVDGIALERKIFYPLYDTQGVKEGISAFIEKRKPNMKDL